MERERVIQLDSGPSETYIGQACCANCDYAGAVNIPKGVLIGDGTCPNCGCKKLTKLVLKLTDFIATDVPHVSQPMIPRRDWVDPHIQFHTLLPVHQDDEGQFTLTNTGGPPERVNGVMLTYELEAQRREGARRSYRPDVAGGRVRDLSRRATDRMSHQMFEALMSNQR